MLIARCARDRARFAAVHRRRRSRSGAARRLAVRRACGVAPGGGLERQRPTKARSRERSSARGVGRAGRSWRRGSVGAGVALACGLLCKPHDSAVGERRRGIACLAGVIRLSFAPPSLRGPNRRRMAACLAHRQSRARRRTCLSTITTTPIMFAFPCVPESTPLDFSRPGRNAAHIEARRA